jgi:hypothetical protein
MLLRVDDVVQAIRKDGDKSSAQPAARRNDGRVKWGREYVGRQTRPWRVTLRLSIFQSRPKCKTCSLGHAIAISRTVVSSKSYVTIRRHELQLGQVSEHKEWRQRRIGNNTVYYGRSVFFAAGV